MLTSTLLIGLLHYMHALRPGFNIPLCARRAHSLAGVLIHFGYLALIKVFFFRDLLYPVECCQTEAQ